MENLKTWSDDANLMRAPRTRFRASCRLASTVFSTCRASSDSEVKSGSLTDSLRGPHSHLGVEEKSQRECVFPRINIAIGWARKMMALASELRLELIREFGSIFL